MKINSIIITGATKLKVVIGSPVLGTNCRKIGKVISGEVKDDGSIEVGMQIDDDVELQKYKNISIGTYVGKND